MAFSPDGRRFACETGPLSIMVYDAMSGQEISTRTDTSDRLDDNLSLGVQPRRPARCRDFDRTVRIWDAATGQEIRTLPGRKFPFSSLVFSPDGLRLASGYSDGGVQVWDAATGQEVGTLKGGTSVVCSLAFSPDGRRLSSVAGDGAVKLWDVTGAQETFAFQAPYARCGTRGVRPS